MAYKNKNIVKDGPFFTHFASLPLRLPEQRQKIAQIQQKVRERLHSEPQFSSPQLLREHSHELSHLTLFKLILRHNSTRQKLASLLKHFQEEINSTLAKFPLELTGIKYFTRFNKNAKSKEITVIYLQVAQQTAQALIRLTDRLVRALLKEDIMATQELKDMNVIYDHNCNLYRPQTLHVSLFRASNLFQSEQLHAIMKELQQECASLQFDWTSFDISTMKEYDSDAFYLPLIRFPIDLDKQEDKI